MHAITIPAIYIIIVAGVALLLVYIMKALSKNFLTLYVFVRAFKIFDLEFAATPLELSTYVKGIFEEELPASVAQRSSRSLRQFLILSILCQVLIAAVLFFTCNRIASHDIHKNLFLILGWAQVISLASGLIRASFFLSYIRKDAQPVSEKSFKIHRIIEIIKWAIPLITSVTIASIFLYLWFSGLLNLSLLRHFVILVAVAVLVFLIKKYAIRSKEVSLESFREIGN